MLDSLASTQHTHPGLHVYNLRLSLRFQQFDLMASFKNPINDIRAWDGVHVNRLYGHANLHRERNDGKSSLLQRLLHMSICLFLSRPPPRHLNSAVCGRHLRTPPFVCSALRIAQKNSC